MNFLMINNPLKTFTIEVHNRILDAVAESMVKRFKINETIWAIAFYHHKTLVKLQVYLQSLSDKLMKFDERATNENILTK